MRTSSPSDAFAASWDALPEDTASHGEVTRKPGEQGGERGTPSTKGADTTSARTKDPSLEHRPWLEVRGEKVKEKEKERKYVSRHILWRPSTWLQTPSVRTVKS